MPWELGSGNKSDYDFHITSAFFAPDANYQNGEVTLLHLSGYDEDNEECTEMYNVGKDWISPDGGETVVSTKNAKKINRTSMFGHFIQYAFQTNISLPYLLEKKGDATEAKVWVGLVFHMDETEITFGRGINPVFRNMPTKFLGDESGQQSLPLTVASQTVDRPTFASQAGPGSPQPAASPNPGPSAAERIAAAKASAQVPTPAPSTPPVESPSTNGAQSIDTTKLATLAKSAESLEIFINGAVELPGVAEDDDLLNLVLDPTERGFYALNHGLA